MVNAVLQIKNDTTANVASYTGAVGELVIDNQLYLAYIQDGVTAGGHLIGGSVAFNWLIANNNTNFATAPTSTGTNSIVAGNHARDYGASNSIVLGTNSDLANSSIDQSIVVGSYSTAAASGSSICGANSYADLHSSVLGFNNSAQPYSSVVGTLGYASAYGEVLLGYSPSCLHSNTLFMSDSLPLGLSVNTNASRSWNPLFGQTVNNIPILMTASDGSTGYILAPNSYYWTFGGDIQVKLMACDTTGVAYALWNIEFFYNSVAGTFGPQTATLIDSLGTGSTWSYVITFDNVNLTVQIQITGDVALIVNWKAKVIVDGM